MIHYIWYKIGVLFKFHGNNLLCILHLRRVYDRFENSMIDLKIAGFINSHVKLILVIEIKKLRIFIYFNQLVLFLLTKTIFTVII